MLKLLACLFMLLDHIGYYGHPWLPDWLVVSLRTIGRLAFPIFAWSVAAGYTRTRNIFMYFIRMTVFALLAEIVIRVSHSYANLDWPGTNVLVTFTLAIVLITGFRLARNSYFDMVASLRPISPGAGPLAGKSRFDVRVNPGGIELDPRIGLPMGVLVMLLAMVSSLWLKPDYGLYGVLAVTIFYIVREYFNWEDQLRRSLQLYILLNAAFLVFWVLSDHMSLEWAILQTFSVAALPLCYLRRNDKKPGLLTKYFFYVFYPGHLAILALLYRFFDRMS